MAALSEAGLRRWWARNQGLAAGDGRDPLAAVRRCAGVQAQDLGGARMQVRARTRGLTAAAVDRALHEERSVVRTWAMRGTLHLVPAEGVRGLTGLLGPVTETRYARRRAELGLTPALLERALELVPAALAGRGPVTRPDLVRALEERGVRIEPSGQAPAHLLMVAAGRGLVCRGPEGAGGVPTCVLLDEWLPPEPPRDADAVLADLALAHLEAFGPSDERDLGHWSGLPAAVARRGFGLVAGRMRPVETPLGRRWVAARARPPREPDGPPTVRLLGAFDPHLLGHRERSAVLPPADDRRVASGGWILPALLVDGRVTGTWRAERTARRVGVVVSPFAALDPAAADGVAAEARDVGRFLGLEAELRVAEA